MFEAGYVTYSNAAKISQLKVSEDVVDTFGAVSVATAWAMARGALPPPMPMSRWRLPGLPGQPAERPSKPVGTVVFARPSAVRTLPRSSPTRNSSTSPTAPGVRLQAALCALDLLMP